MTSDAAAATPRWRATTGGVALLLAVLSACGDKDRLSASGDKDRRSIALFGVTVATSMSHSLAVVADSTDTSGRPLQPCYAMLGNSPGRQIVHGEPLPAGSKVHLRLGVDADIWHTDATGATKQVQSKSLPGLSGANVGNGTLELRGALATRELDVEPGAQLTVDFRDGQILVDGR